MLVDFCALFDTSNPALIQRGFDMYTDGDQGIQLALTKDHYYGVKPEDVQPTLEWLLPKGYVSWTSGPALEQVDLKRGPGVYTITRNGTFTLQLNYWLRKLFWSSYVHALPAGEVFPYTNVTDFHNSDKAPAIGLLDVKLGGLSGDPEKGWKVIGITLVKLT